MEIRKIRKLIELIKTSGISEIEVKEGEESVRIACYPASPTPTAFPITPPTPELTSQPSQPKATTNSTAEDNVQELTGHVVRSPMVGTVYLSPSPGAKPFIEIGQHVKAGDTLCLIEAMKMFNPIEVDISGVITARLVQDSQPVEFDQPLFTIQAD